MSRRWTTNSTQAAAKATNVLAVPPMMRISTYPVASSDSDCDAHALQKTKRTQATINGYAMSSVWVSRRRDPHGSRTPAPCIRRPAG